MINFIINIFKKKEKYNEHKSISFVYPPLHFEIMEFIKELKQEKLTNK